MGLDLPVEESTAKVRYINVHKGLTHFGLSNGTSVFKLAPLYKDKAEPELISVGEAPFDLAHGIALMFVTPSMLLLSIAFDHVESLLAIDVSFSFHEDGDAVEEAHIHRFAITPGGENRLDSD